MRFLIALALWLLVLGAPASAQTSPCLATPAPPPTGPLPIVPVLGAGEIVLCVPLPAAQAQAQTYRAYLDGSSVGVVLTASCAAVAANMTECPVPLAQLPLKTTHRIEVSAAASAADGELESAKVLLPFDLRLLAPPVPPATGLGAVRPGAPRS